MKELYSYWKERVGLRNAIYLVLVMASVGSIIGFILASLLFGAPQKPGFLIAYANVELLLSFLFVDYGWRMGMQDHHVDGKTHA